MEQPQTSLFSSELKIDETAKNHIRSMASWIMIIVTVAVIGYAINILGLFSNKNIVMPRTEGFGSSLITDSNSPGQVLFSVIIGLLLNYFLFRFASGAKSALNGMNQAQMASSFRSLKIYFVITSILLILVTLFLFIGFFALLSNA